MPPQPEAVAESTRPLDLDGVVPYPSAAVQDYRDRGLWIGETHWDVLEASVARNADTVAVRDERRALTYRELRDNALSRAMSLSAMGIGRGDRVVVHFPNVVEFVETTFALFAIGALPIFALPAHRASEIRYFIEFADAAAYVTVDAAAGFDYGRLADEMKGEFAGLATMVLALGDTPTAAGDHDSYRCPALPSDIAFLQLSGGTTGQPKLIPRTHDDYLYSVRESNRICGVTADTVLLVVLPVSHNFTMSSPGILGALHVGATVVLAPNPSPDTAFELIEQHRVTMVSVVPPVALAWMNSSLRHSHELSSLQTIQVGGAKLSQSAAQRIESVLGARLQQVFGMAEGLVNYTRLDDDATTVTTTQGRPISAADEVRVVDDNDHDVPTGQAGHLLTRGPYTIRGYYRAPEHNAKSFTADGFYRTGDIVTRDSRGYLTVVGRAKDQINRGGEKIAPEEVENHLLAHDAVHDASVVGIPDDHLGERSKAYVVLRADHAAAPPSAIEIRRFLRQRDLAAYKIPDVVEFVTEFPRTSVGKISKNDQRTAREESVGDCDDRNERG